MGRVELKEENRIIIWCNFCGLGEDDGLIIVGNAAYHICEECLEKYNNQLEKKREKIINSIEPFKEGG